MTDTDWKEEAGMGAEPPVPESPVIPPVAEGTEPGPGNCHSRECRQNRFRNPLRASWTGRKRLLPICCRTVARQLVRRSRLGRQTGRPVPHRNLENPGSKYMRSRLQMRRLENRWQNPYRKMHLQKGQHRKRQMERYRRRPPERRRRQAHSQAPRMGRGNPGLSTWKRTRIFQRAPIPDTMPVGREGAPQQDMARPRMRTPISTMDSIRILTWVRPTASRRKVGRIKIRRRRMHRRIRSSKYTGTTSSSRASRRWAVRCLRSLPRGGSRGRTAGAAPQDERRIESVPVDPRHFGGPVPGGVLCCEHQHGRAANGQGGSTTEGQSPSASEPAPDGGTSPEEGQSTPPQNDATDPDNAGMVIEPRRKGTG